MDTVDVITDREYLGIDEVALAYVKLRTGNTVLSWGEHEPVPDSYHPEVAWQFRENCHAHILLRERLLTQNYIAIHSANPWEEIPGAQRPPSLVVPDHEHMLIPTFQLSQNDRSAELFSCVTALLQRRLDGWDTWLWWVADNRYLDNEVPSVALSKPKLATAIIHAAMHEST